MVNTKINRILNNQMNLYNSRFLKSLNWLEKLLLKKRTKCQIAWNISWITNSFVMIQIKTRIKTTNIIIYLFNSVSHDFAACFDYSITFHKKKIQWKNVYVYFLLYFIYDVYCYQWENILHWFWRQNQKKCKIQINFNLSKICSLW